MLKVTPRELVGRIVSVMGPVTSAAEIFRYRSPGFLSSTVLKDFHKRIAGIALVYDTASHCGRNIGVARREDLRRDATRRSGR